MKLSLKILTCALCIMLIITGCTSIKGTHNLKTFGLEYQLQELKEPRPNRVHVLRVDLTNNRIQPDVVIAADPDGDGPAEAALTNPLKLAKDRSVLAFVNTNPWDSFPDATDRKNTIWYEGQPVDIHGLAVSSSEIRSQPKYSGASVWINASGDVFLGDNTENRLVVEGMGGFQRIVKEGIVIVEPDNIRHPRTAIGLSRDGNIMWLVVVDGRQKQHSEGMDLHELGCIMRDIGCWSATNMDGGGSSIMGLIGAEGRLQVVNSPSDRYLGVVKIRPLPMILTIRKR